MPVHPQPLIAAPAETEAWRNSTAATVVLKKFNQLGQLDEERVIGGRSVVLTPHERRINQEMAASESLDVFKNGMLSPVRLLDSEEDTEEIKANANAMSEPAMKALFKSQIKTFKAKVEEISNPNTLNRLLEIANEVDASIRQADTIKERLAEVTPKVAQR
jgi:hypothetical protein